MKEGNDVVTILLVEDQELIRLGLKLALDRVPNFCVIGEAEDGLAAVKMASELKPKVIVMDIGLPGMDGVEATQLIKKALPKTRIIMVTTHDADEDIFAALNAGADGYCLKNIAVDQLALAITTVTTGAAWLDPAIASRVLRAGNKSTISTGSTTLPQAGQVTFSKNEQEILSYVEQGLSYEQIAERLMIDVEKVKNYMCQILERMVVPKRISGQLTTSTGQGSGSRLSTANDISGQQDIEMMTEEPPVPTNGTILTDRYVIESMLGSGGMSRVYLAKHLMMDKEVAIKMLHAHLITNKLVLKRFQQEAKMVSGLNHPNIVKIFDFGLTEYGQPYLVMDYVNGQSLQALLHDPASLNLERVVHIFSQVLDGLAAAHAAGIIHRDLKPSNIMVLDLETVKDFVMIIDFGIAKIFLGDDPQAVKLTRTGEVYGSLAYMSPEQCQNAKCDQRTDIYSLGCVMYEILTGKLVFSGTSPYKMISQQVQETPKHFAEICPDRHIPTVLENLVFKALAKDPKARFQSALEMKDALTSVLAQS